MQEINFTPEPTCARFMQSDSFGRLIAGPIGSAKTTSAIFELMRRSLQQEADASGLRKTRWAIVRQTLKQLEDTILKDILEWFGRFAEYKVSNRTIFITIGDVRSEWLLIPLDDPEDQRRLLSMQLTGAWMSECIEMNFEIIAPLSGRCGRFPPFGATWCGIVADTNMPTEGTAWQKHMENPPPDWQIFIQPGGLSSEAENLNWLNQTPQTKALPLNHPDRIERGREYYRRSARNQSKDWVKRYVHAQYGSDPSGTAVYGDSFNKALHVVPGLTLSRAPLIVGQDFGRDPWAVICQLDSDGRFLVHEECPATDIGLEAFIQTTLIPMLGHERYAGLPVMVIGDPSGVAKGSIYEETSFDVLKRFGFSAYPAPTNNLDPRLRAVESFMLGLRKGLPALAVDAERCPTVVRALNGEYKFGKLKGGQRKTTPDKNDASHPMDALQYAALAAHGGQSRYIATRMHRPTHATRRTVTASSWT